MRYHLNLGLARTALIFVVVGAVCRPAVAQLRGHWRLQETSGTTAVDT